MIVLAVSGVLAVLCIVAVVEGVQSGDVAKVELLLCIVAAELGEQAVDAVHAAVVVAVTVLELVTHLQVECADDGFAVAQTGAEVVRSAGRCGVLVVEVVRLTLVVIDFRAAERLALAVSVGTAKVERHVAPRLVQPSVEL